LWCFCFHSYFVNVAFFCIFHFILPVCFIYCESIIIPRITIFVDL
jgi:hypothetical protein